MPVGQMPVGEQQSLDQNTRQIHKGGPPWMYGHHNVRASAEDNTGQNTKDIHPKPRTEIKIPDPAGNRTRAAGLEDRDSTGDRSQFSNVFKNSSCESAAIHSL